MINLLQKKRSGYETRVPLRINIISKLNRLIPQELIGDQYADIARQILAETDPEGTTDAGNLLGN